jgi:3-phenylpropionate/trans-cinnamate dioxygenase ferredoxin reductase subunit
MSDPRTFVIVGAGQAGRWIASTLRAEGFAGRIVWFGDEPHLPYDRPPLSKAALQGEAALARLTLLDGERLAALALEWRAGEAVTAIDRAARAVTSSAGLRVAYDALFLATGGRARTLPGLAPHPRVLGLRTWEDAGALKAQLARARQALVLGGGWIGLEVAASARQLGCAVTVLEAAPRLCARTVPPCVSDHLAELHTRHGVTLRLGATVRAVRPQSDRVEVELDQGELLRGDLLVVGIGLLPNDALAAAAGLPTANGVLTDAEGRTEDPAIFAAGDVANALRADGQRARLESWENAQRQAVAAARAALGLAPDAAAARAPAWFWSDQYDDNLQVLGQPLEHHRVIERALPTARQRLFFFCDGPRIAALAAVNAARDLKLVRKWITEDRFPPLEALADAGVALNKLPLEAVAAAASAAAGSRSTEMENQAMNDWIDAGARDQVDADTPLAASLGAVKVGIFEVDGALHAVEDVCPHAYALLTQGFQDGAEVECPLHNAVFCLKDGKHLRGEPCRDLHLFPVRVLDGRIQIRAAGGGDNPAGAPASAHQGEQR